MTTKQKDRSFFYVLGLFWFALMLLNWLVPKQAFSEAENRPLASFPVFTVNGLLDGDFMDDVDGWLNDHFVGRPFWVSGQTLMEYSIGKREVNSVFLGRQALLGDLPPEKTEMSQENMIGINSFADRYSLPVAVMLIPSSAAMQPEKLPAFAQSWDEKAYIQNTYAELSSSVKTVQVVPTLQQHKQEYIYYRTDHHWTGYGAWLASQQLAETLGLPLREQSDFAPETISNDFLGTYHSKTGFPLVQADSIQRYQIGQVVSYEVFDGQTTKQFDGIYFDEFLGKKDKYSYFLGQVQPVATIRTRSSSGKKLLVFKDSYAHALLPMLMEDYSEIKMVDLRYINATDYEAELGISGYDQALFLYSADVFAHQPGPYKLQ